MLDSGTRLGPYEILAALGSGGMGEVYRARDTRLNRHVAVKVLPAGTASPHALERFEREAKAIAALNHPGICAIHDVGTTPVPFLVMELLDGETLHQRLTRGPLEIHALIEMAITLADALTTAHAKGIIHRDLKPANIFVTAHGPKVLDFGLARATEPVAVDIGITAPTMAETPLTDAGVAVGTVAYMSPEQVRGDTLGAQTDLFSLGLVLYEMATGERAFGGATMGAASAAILHEHPPRPRQLRPELPARLEQAILTLLEKDRDVRTQTASELRAELTRVKRELGSARTPDAPTPSVAPLTGSTTAAATSPTALAAPPSSSDAQLIVEMVRRHRSVVVTAAAVLLLSAIGVVYFVRARTPAAPGVRDLSGLSIADLQIEPLTTSGTADAPAVSPDGSYVVYVEHGSGRDSLRVRRVATGSNVEIVAPEPGTALRGGTFTPDGEFVNYVKQAGGQPFELWQVPVLGGAARRLVQGGRVTFSPVGDQMAYVRTGSGGRTELVVTARDGSGERVVASRQLPERFWPAGVTSSFAPAWSPNGATIAILGGKDGESPTGQIVFVDVKSGSERTADAGPTRIGTGVAWLADDTLIASMLDRPSAPLQLWLVSAANGTFRRLTNDTSQYVGVNVTADRNALVTARAEYSFDIWTSDAAATNWSQPVPTQRSKGPIGIGVRWIGDDLLYVSSSSQGFALTRWRASTQSEEVLAPGGGNPSVTRDGSTIFFLDYDSRELWTMDQTGQNRLQIRRAMVSPEAAHVTPDGRHYVAIDTRAGGAPAIVLAALDGTNTSRPITADRIRPAAAVLEGGRVEVSPDGLWIAYPSVGEGNQPVIAVCNVAACSSRRMLPARARWRWMPDSKALAYVDTKTLSDLWIQPLDGSAPRQLTHFAPDGHVIWDFDWSTDGRRLAVARAKTSTDIVLFRGLGTRK